MPMLEYIFKERSARYRGQKRKEERKKFIEIPLCVRQFARYLKNYYLITPQSISKKMDVIFPHVFR